MVSTELNLSFSFLNDFQYPPALIELGNGDSVKEF